jgi:hypothetical protein
MLESSCARTQTPEEASDIRSGGQIKIEGKADEQACIIATTNGFPTYHPGAVAGH